MRLWIGVVSLLIGAAGAQAEENWTEYRGPYANGHSKATGLPLRWSDTQNVKWKTPIPGRGWSTPAIWKDQIWLTTADDDGKTMSVLCVDKESGKIRFRRTLFENESPESRHDTNSYASPSPVLEAGRVYVHFGTYGTACLDTQTFKVLWERRDIQCSHSVGPGSSPVLYRDLLILTMDGVDKQYVIALNKRTGDTVWKRDRSLDMNQFEADVRKAFTTPILIQTAEGAQLISSGAQAVYGYEPTSGKELWRVRFSGYSQSSRPLIHKGTLFVNTGFNVPSLLAIKLGGSGDLTSSNIRWQYGKQVPSKSSPLLIDGLLYMVNDSGVTTCLDAVTGEVIWKERIDGPFSSSPIYADGRLYFCNERGKTIILKPGRKFEVLAENELPDGFMASPAVSGKALFLRTKTHLYRIEP